MLNFDQSGVNQALLSTPSDCHYWLSGDSSVYQSRFRPGLCPGPRWGTPYALSMPPVSGSQCLPHLAFNAHSVNSWIHPWDRSKIDTFLASIIHPTFNSFCIELLDLTGSPIKAIWLVRSTMWLTPFGQTWGQGAIFWCIVRVHPNEGLLGDEVVCPVWLQSIIKNCEWVSRFLTAYQHS